MAMLARTLARRVIAKQGALSTRLASVSYSTGLPSLDGEAQVVVFDTTLRDGEQTPGVTLDHNEKLVIASKLAELGVDVCEAGFPMASTGDYESVRAIAEKIGNEADGRICGEPMKICGLARAREPDIDRCYDAVRHAKHSRIHTFLATSDIHLEHKLKISREECLTQIDKMVRYAKDACFDVEFSPEDAGRSDKDFLVEALGVAIEAGATTLNIPDTVGYNTPEMYGDLIAYLVQNTVGGADVIWSTHCHNDLGLATANTLAGVMNGARQVEVTINGIGERAGNTSLEELVMTLAVHKLAKTNIITENIMSTSKMVCQYTGIPVQPNKAIVGKNAFSHESGIHQDGVLKHQETYEIMKPETIGLFDHNNLVLGKLSGRNGFKTRAKSLGYKFLTEEQLNEAFTVFKELCDSRKNVSDGDIHAIIRRMLHSNDDFDWKLIEVSLSTNSTALSKSTATVAMESPSGEIVTKAFAGSTSVMALYSCIDSIMNSGCVLQEYTIQSVSAGSDAIGTVVCHVSEKGGIDMFRGEGNNSDVLVASAEAYISAQNFLLTVRGNALLPDPDRNENASKESASI